MRRNYEIINALFRIHNENTIHRDLHSGNILHSSRTADKRLSSIYGNLPYIAPEAIAKKRIC